MTFYVYSHFRCGLLAMQIFLSYTIESYGTFTHSPHSSTHLKNFPVRWNDDLIAWVKHNNKSEKNSNQTKPIQNAKKCYVAIDCWLNLKTNDYMTKSSTTMIIKWLDCVRVRVVVYCMRYTVLMCSPKTHYHKKNGENFSTSSLLLRSAC